MSNESWYRKFLAWDPCEQMRKEIIRTNNECSSFQEGDDGYCKHYTGCRELISSSCARQCALESK